MEKTILNDVSDTALWVAVYRQKETERPDALFRDPYAKVLAGPRGALIDKKMSGARYTQWSVTIRTYIIDKYIEKLIAAGADTVINLGCGLDTRPYRLNLPANLKWVEVDFPHMIRLKDERLANEVPRCQLERVSLDLSDEKARDRLFARLNAETRRAVILTEGVLPYLSEEQVASLGHALRAQPNFKYWIMEYFSAQMLKYVNTPKRKKQMRNAPFIFNPADWFGFFEKLGWKKTEIRYTAEVTEEVGRKVPMPWFMEVVRLFVRVRMPEAYRRLNGYMIAEPN